jgi:hypothetical protein
MYTVYTAKKLNPEDEDTVFPQNIDTHPDDSVV